MIPKILHFCFGMSRDFGGAPWSLVHHVCIKTAVERIKPAKAFIYCEYEPRNRWWQLTREMVTVEKITAPREIFGNQLLHPAHRADVVRLEKLLEFGGIYLDCDVFVHRDFDDLLQHSAVLGQEGEGGHYGLCNAVILAEPQAPFIKRWYGEYRSFRSTGQDDYWNEHSVQIPSVLSRYYPKEITVLPHTAFFHPAWGKEDLKKIFESVGPICLKETYATHLWESKSWYPYYLGSLTPGRVRHVNNNFHYWVRPMVTELPANFGAPTIPWRFSMLARRVVRDVRYAVEHLNYRMKRAVQLMGSAFSNLVAK